MRSLHTRRIEDHLAGDGMGWRPKRAFNSCKMSTKLNEREEDGKKK